MSRHAFSSVTDQVTETLLDEIRSGRWKDVMPGRLALARELGVNHKTVGAALKTLEKAGWLEHQDSGKGRRVTPQKRSSSRKLRIVILGYEKSDLTRHDIVTLLHQLQAEGHLASFAGATLRQLGMKMARIARFVEKTEADAWIVVAGSREVLDWFAARPTPALALYGRSKQVRMASSGPQKRKALHRMLDRLVALGHRHIVMLAREERRKPLPGILEQHFLDHLETCGIPTSIYNLPDWNDTPEAFRRLLNSLFRHTPPTALIIDDTALFFATMQHLAGIGIVAPGKVSLACTDSDPNFAWCYPSIAHIAWNSGPVIRRVLNWANHLNCGLDDLRKTASLARFVDGGTIGPVPGGPRRMKS